MENTKEQEILEEYTKRENNAFKRSKEEYGKNFTNDDDKNKIKTKILWPITSLMTILHIAFIYASYLVFYSKWQTIIFSLFLYLISALGVTAGSHRLWSHHSYSAKLSLRILLALFHCIAGQRNIYEWCRDHRVHHKYVESDADPHDARRGFIFSHIGWICSSKHPEVIKKGATIDFSDLLDDPVVRWQKKYYYPLYIALCFVLPTLVPYYFWNESLIISFFVSVIFRYVVTLHIAFSINSIAHMWGSRPYETNSNPRDNKSLAAIAAGEGFHNFHHTFPSDYSTSEWGWSYNMTTVFIDICSYLGLAYGLKKSDPEIIRKRKERTGQQ